MKKKKGLMEEISGINRKRTYVLHKFEDRLMGVLLKIMPKWIETYHLTLSSLLSSLIAIYSGYLYEENKYWLLGIPFVLIFHWLTDMMDGEVGRRKNTGLVKWGFYADHFLDVLFMSSIFIGYALAFPQLFLVFMFLIVGMALFFVDSVLCALVGGEYSTSGFLGIIGPSEASFVIATFGISFVFLPYISSRFYILILIQILI